jgi:AraC family transcriptional regulator
MCDAWFGDCEPRPRTFMSRNDVAAGGIDFAFVTEEITTPTDWRLHEPEHIIAVLRGGQPMSMEFEFEGGLSGRTISRAGDIWIIPAQQRHAALVEGSTTEFCEMRIPTKLFGDRPLETRIRHRDPFLVALIDRMSTAIGGDGVAGRLLTESLASTIQLHLTDRVGGGLDADKRSHRKLTPAQQASLIEFLEDGLDTNISLETLANHASMAVNVFLTAFAEAFGTTPHQFLLDRRINRAKTLLTMTTQSVTDIGHAVGFSSPSHFTTTFKQRVGFTPTAFRRITT